MSVILNAVVQDLGLQLSLSECRSEERRLHVHRERAPLPAHVSGGLGAAEHMRNIPCAAIGERVNTSPKLPRHLFICGPAARNQHHVKPSEARDWDKKQTSHTHYSHSYSSVWRVQLMAVVQDINQAKAKHVNDVGGK